MPFIGEIRIFAGNFAPAGWMFCQGQILSIAENDTLFNLIGTTYGGDGQTTFMLPDLRGRVPLHINPSYPLGSFGGAESLALVAANLPAHTHNITGTVAVTTLGENPGTLSQADNNYPAITSGPLIYSTNQHATNRLGPLKVASFAPGTMLQVQPTGNNQPKNNMQPFTAINFIISLYGIYPSAT
ncbi:phage tail protein [Chitinophaga sp. 30R24]|uniref:phage tail protein n=1 Tax=Chitinophaga sp. 30R24 TaxID=3248838 RepID=UPI003B914599